MGSLDEFKKYNRKFGQTSGDSVLEAFAQILKAGLRKTDVACHYGNSEFFIILPATDADRARKVVERIRLKSSQMPEVEHAFREHVFGLSAGIVEFPQVATTADGLICMAECALYYAKMRGGNRSVLISDLETQLTKEPNMERLHEVYDMVEYVETRDPITYGHSENVAIISELIGKAMGLSTKELADLRAAALLHDVGKVGIPDSILTKPCKLTEDEWELMKTHSEAGAKIVGCTEGLANLAPIIRHHHEWYDGTGYPDGLKREEIPLGAGIISIADAYDTMTSERPYSKAMLQESALDELRRCAGTQFDPRLVDIFVFGVKIQAILQKRNLDEMKLLEAKRQLDSDKTKKYIQDTGTFNFN
jgi:diguanylate cyclase (GGDEF)-like protein